MSRQGKRTLAVCLACASIALAILPAAIPYGDARSRSDWSRLLPVLYLLSSVAAAGTAGVVLSQSARTRAGKLGSAAGSDPEVDRDDDEIRSDAKLKHQLEVKYRTLLDECARTVDDGHADTGELTSQLRRTNAELRFSNHRLIEQDRMRDQYVALLSHELKTPLAAICSYVEILCNYENSLDVDKRRECLDILQREANRCSRLVSDLLDMAQLDRGGVVLDAVEIDCAGLAHQVVTSLSPLAERRSQRIAFVAKDGPLLALADADRVVQIVTNLLGNAIKFTPVGGQIEVAITALGEDRIEIGIADSGDGIAPEERELVFGAFYRGSGVDESEGCGLGLYLSRELAVRMSAELFVEDSALGGVRFVLRLPAR